MISVVMPAYNAEEYIAEAIKSILKQTYKDFEFIIVNDGSRDRTADIIKSFGDDRIVFINRHDNKGLVFSLNEGISYAKGDFIARMDADDISTPDRFALQLKYFDNHPEVDVLGGSYHCFGNSCRTVKRETNPEVVAGLLRYYCCMAHPTIMMRRKVIYQKELYSQDYLYAEDFELWGRLLARGTVFANIPNVILKYRVTDTHISSKHYKRQQFLTAAVMLRNYLIFYPDIIFNDKSATSDEGLRYCCQIIEKLSTRLNPNRNERKIFSRLCYLFARCIEKSRLQQSLWYWKVVPFSIKNICFAMKIIIKGGIK